MAKILIVDDSEVQRIQLRKDLEKGSHTVIEADNGVVGLRQAAAHPDIALIICDLNMNEMDGLTMCAKLMEMTPPFRAPIFMLTTEANSQMKLVAKQFGVRAWIAKPYNPERILQAVAKVT